MKILFKKEDFAVRHYEIQLGETELNFLGEETAFSLPYFKVNDFCVTQDRRGKAYFTALYNGKICEGQILDPKEIVPFVSKLQEKIGGVIRIDVQKY